MRGHTRDGCRVVFRWELGSFKKERMGKMGRKYERWE